MSNTKSNIAIVGLLATTFLPTTELFNIVKIVIVFLMCCVVGPNSKESITARNWKSIIGFWLISLFTASMFVLIFESSFNINTIIHELSRIIYYALVLALCAKIKVEIKFLFYCCSIILAVHFAVQVTQYLRMGIFDPYIVKYYLAGDADNVHYQLAIKDYYQFRSGSIFINPNVYVCYPYLSIGVFGEYSCRTKSPLPLIMILVAFISVVLTGSRMGLVSCFIILGWFFFFGSKRRDNKGGSLMIIFAIVAVILLGVLNWDKVSSMTQDLRAFNVDEAYAGSGSAKLGGLIAYITHCNPIYWLSGSLGSGLLTIQMDMELGYIFSWFGVLGIIWYTKLLKTVYRNNWTNYRVLSTISTISILLTALGATSVLNMSVFPYICAISLTTIKE